MISVSELDQIVDQLLAKVQIPDAAETSQEIENDATKKIDDVASFICQEQLSKNSGNFSELQARCTRVLEKQKRFFDSIASWCQKSTSVDENLRKESLEIEERGRVLSVLVEQKKQEIAQIQHERSCALNNDILQLLTKCKNGIQSNENNNQQQLHLQHQQKMNQHQNQQQYFQPQQQQQQQLHYSENQQHQNLMQQFSNHQQQQSNHNTNHTNSNILGGGNSNAGNSNSSMFKFK